MELPTLVTLPDSTPGYKATGLRVSVITKRGRENLCHNPSFEVNTTGWAGTSTNQPVRNYDWQAVGAFSASYIGEAPTTYLFYSNTVDDFTGKLLGISFFFKGKSGCRYSAIAKIIGAVNDPPYATHTWSASGQTERVQFVMQKVTAGYANLGFEFSIQQIYPTTPISIFYIDGLLLEDITNDLEITTYFDGDSLGMIPTRKDFYWLGQPHNSRSVRIEQSAAGGHENFLDDMGFQLMSTIGMGFYSPLPVLNNIGRGQQTYQDSLIPGRTFTLTGKIYSGSGPDELRRRRAELIEKLKPNRANPAQPILLRFYYPYFNLPVEVKAVYQSGLEGQSDNSYQENLALTFVCVDTFFHDIINYGTVIDVEIVGSAGHILRRTPIGGWASFSTGLSSGKIVQIANHPYLNMLFAVGTQTNKAHYYDVAGATWTALDGTNPPDDTVNTITFTRDNLYAYIGGKFLNVGGVARNRVVRYTISSGAWASLSTGTNGEVYTSVVDNFNNVWFGGAFTTPENYVTYWDSAIFHTTAGGPGSACNKLIVSPLGKVYAACASAVKYWDGAAWVSLGATTGGEAKNIIFGSDGNLYCFGTYTAIGGITAAGMAYYNGSNWIAMPTNEIVNFRDAIIDQDGFLVIKGWQNSTAPGIFWWNGSRWCSRDINGQAGSSDSWNGLEKDNEGNIYVGAISLSPFEAINPTTLQNVGPEEAEPHFVVYSANRLNLIANYTTKKYVYFNELYLAPGEIVHILIARTGIKAYSQYRPDLSQFINQGSSDDSFLAPGENVIGVFSNSNSNNLCHVFYAPSRYSLDRVS